MEPEWKSHHRLKVHVRTSGSESRPCGNTGTVGHLFSYGVPVGSKFSTPLSEVEY